MVTLPRLLLAHGIITSAAGVVLVLAPGAIPGAVDVRLGEGGFLLCYLLAAAEFALALLCIRARRLDDLDALRVIVDACITFHAASAVLEVVAFYRGVSAPIWGNVAVRLVIITLFARARLGTITRGRSHS